MDALINTLLDSVWEDASVLGVLATPDDILRRSFTVATSTAEAITIITEGGTSIAISRRAIHATIRYLLANVHTEENPCEIGSSNQDGTAGPLCRAAREENGGTRVINYIAPLLVRVGLAAIESVRPNRIWLI